MLEAQAPEADRSGREFRLSPSVALDKLSYASKAQFQQLGNGNFTDCWEAGFKDDPCRLPPHKTNSLPIPSSVAVNIMA